MGLIQYLLPFMILNIYVSLEGIDKSLDRSRPEPGVYRVAGFQGSHLAAKPAGGQCWLSAGLCFDGRHLYTADDPGRPGNEMIANLIFNRVIGTLDWPFGSAISVILLTLLVIIVYTYNRYLGINQIFKSLIGEGG